MRDPHTVCTSLAHLRSTDDVRPRLHPPTPAALNGAKSNTIMERILFVPLLALFAATTALAQSREAIATLPGHTPPQVLDGTALLAGHYDPQKMLRLAIAVTPPHPAEEEQFIQELINPGSPHFHEFLTAEEWDARFAPAAEDEQKIVDWAASQGLTVTARFDSRLDIDLEAPAGVIEKAFGVTINNYRVGDEVDYSNDRDPVLPASIAPHVTAVLGLNNIQRMQGNMPESRTVKGPDYTAGPVYREAATVSADGDRTKLPADLAKPVPEYTNGFYDPTDIYSSGAYDFNALQALGHCCNPHGDSTGSPADSSIAIAAFGNVNPADLTGFHNQYPYLALDVSIIQIDGAITCPTSQPNCYNYSGETSLDSEWATATSNSFGSYLDTAHIYVYEGNNGFGSYYDLYNQILKNNNTRVSSTSWSCTENYGCSGSFMSGAHNIFNNLVGMGWTLIAASGDRGATDDCAHVSVSFPGSDTDFISTGGTTLNLDYPTDNFGSETGWQGGQNANSCAPVAGSGGNNGGSGGGVSVVYAKPSWQSSFSGSGRLVPDISLNASIGQNYYFNGGLHGVGGTSIVDPEYAGFFAQENSYLAYIGSICGSNHASACTPIGAANPVIYYQGVHNYAQHDPFYDITSGCNSNNITTADHLHYFCAGPGFDEVTGWGSANMLQLAWALNWGVLNNYANGIPYVSWGGAATGKWYNTNQTVTWTIEDYDGNVPNPHHVGIAGETQSWDAAIPDATSEPHGGSGNPFYSGPQFVNDSTGCLSIIGGGCSGSSQSQGCHTAHVRGWNNEGWSTGDVTRGPICYDTVAPSTSISTSTLSNKAVKVTLSASDPGASNGTGSGVAKTYYSVDKSACASTDLGQCTAYSGAFTVTAAGAHNIYYFSEDNAGNFEKEHKVAITVQ